jgi:hypothetical protein
MNDYHAIAIGVATRAEIDTISKYALKINEVLKKYGSPSKNRGVPICLLYRNFRGLDEMEEGPEKKKAEPSGEMGSTFRGHYYPDYWQY